MDAHLAAPDQPAPEALPLTATEEPPPAVETQPDCRAGAPAVAQAPAPVARKVMPGATRKKKNGLPSDWEAKKRMLLLCLLLLIANICVGTYLILTWK